MKFRLQNAPIGREPPSAQFKAGRYNPALVVSYRKRKFTIAAGTGDSVHVWSYGWELYVMSTRPGLDYAGLEIFDARDGCLRADCFLQGVEESEPGFFDLSPATQRKILANYAT